MVDSFSEVKLSTTCLTLENQGTVYLHMSTMPSVGLSMLLWMRLSNVSLSPQSLLVQRKDLLQLMLETSQVSGSQLEEGHVLIHSMGILLAGHETTSSALSFISYLLALNPEVQEKLAEEVVNYLQENPVSSKSVHVVSH